MSRFMSRRTTVRPGRGSVAWNVGVGIAILVSGLFLAGFAPLWFSAAWIGGGLAVIAFYGYALLSSTGPALYEVVPPQASAAESGLVANLRDLERARNEGLISEEEFQRKKEELLDRL